MPPTLGYTTYCDHTLNQYYEPQGDICKPCDKCPRGMGLQPMQERTFEIDPVNGALGCRKCVRCGDQFYSNSFSFEECFPCMDCQQEGRQIAQNCSSTQNTLCGTFLPPSNRSAIVMRPENYSLTIVIPLSVISGVVIVILLAVVIWYIKRRNEDRRQQTSTRSSLPPKSSCYHPVPASTSSGSEFSSRSTMDTVETDGGSDQDRSLSNLNEKIKRLQKMQDMKSLELTEKQALAISKSIAVNDYFHKIGIHLGLTENDIEIIKEDNPKSVQQQSYKTLIKWKQLAASEATVFKLVGVLQLLGLKDIAKELCGTCE